MINNEEQNIIIKAMSRSLDTDIKFLTLALTIIKSKNNPNGLEETSVVILLGKEKLFVLLEDFKEVKVQVDYTAITKVYLDMDNIYSFLICLDKNKLTSGKKLDSIHIFVKDRPVFIKSLICYHSIHSMRVNGVVSELKIKKKKFFIENKEDSLLTKGLEMVHNHPETFIRVVKKCIK